MALFAAAAIALSVERVGYLWVWHRPDAFAAAWRTLSGSDDPVRGVRALFGASKIIQVAVFAVWCVAHDGGLLRGELPGPLAVAAALLLIVAGQVFNVAVFRRLGEEGVFYGSRFGRRVEWERGFPFSWFSHPQYVGTVTTIWGFFLLMRFPHDDWYLVPALESFYYIIGARFEQTRSSSAELGEITW